MTRHARASMPADQEVSIAIDDFTLTGLLLWSPTAHDYEVSEVYMHQREKAVAVDNPEKLGALRDGVFKSFSELLRFEAERVEA